MALTETSVTSDYGTDIFPVTTPSNGGQHIDGRALFIGKACMSKVKLDGIYGRCLESRVSRREAYML